MHKAACNFCAIRQSLNFEGFDSNRYGLFIEIMESACSEDLFISLSASVTVPLFITIMESGCYEDSFISLSASITVPLFITVMESGCYEDSFISLSVWKQAYVRVAHFKLLIHFGFS